MQPLSPLGTTVRVRSGLRRSAPGPFFLVLPALPKATPLGNRKRAAASGPSASPTTPAAPAEVLTTLSGRNFGTTKSLGSATLVLPAPSAARPHPPAKASRANTVRLSAQVMPAVVRLTRGGFRHCDAQTCGCLRPISRDVASRRCRFGVHVEARNGPSSRVGGRSPLRRRLMCWRLFRMLNSCRTGARAPRLQRGQFHVLELRIRAADLSRVLEPLTRAPGKPGVGPVLGLAGRCRWWLKVVCSSSRRASSRPLKD